MPLPWPPNPIPHRRWVATRVVSSAGDHKRGVKCVDSGHMGRWDNVFGIWIALVLAFALVVTIAYHFARKAWRSRSRRDP